jgi:tight adherence protein B
MSIIFAVVAFFIGGGIVFGLGQLAGRLPEMMMRRKLENRIQEVATATDSPQEDLSKKLFKTQTEGPLPVLDRAIGGTARGSALAAWIEQSGTKATLSSVLLMAAVSGVLVAFVAGMFTLSRWSLPMGFVMGAAVPFGVLRMKRAKRMRQFEEQFPEALDLISRALKAGHAFATGLRMAAEELETPVGPEFRKTFDEQNFGLPMKDALENLTRRIPLLDVRFFATAVLIQRETGGNLAEILENLSHVVRERFKILRQVRVYTAHGRLTGYVLLALPAFLSIALMFINPEHMNLLFRERMGQMMLMAAVVMQTIGFLWIKQIVKIEV